MRTLLLTALFAGALVAQQTGQTTTSEASQTQQPSTQDAATKPAEAPADSGAAAEPNFSTSVEVGYRFTSDLAGNLDAYRSVVNLGEGVRLLNFDMRFVNETKGGWLDQFNMRANGWGGDPYNQFRAEALADGKYRLTVDHRSIAYFNALPSFANPRIDQGILFSQQQYDIRRRITDIVLELRPASRLIPYVAFGQNRGFGRGVNTFQTFSNEYPVGMDVENRQQDWRGGVRVETMRYHVTLEQGYTSFKDDQSMFTDDQNFGNRPNLFLGRRLFLNNLLQQYGIRGDGLYSRILATARPVDWLDVYGNFLWSQPENETTYTESASGLLAQQNPVAFVASQNVLLTATSRAPRLNANGGIELRPFRKVRIVSSILTDRLRASSIVPSESVPMLQANPVVPVADRLRLNFSQQQNELFVDAAKWLTLRIGNRHTWGESLTRASSLAQGRQYENAELDQEALLTGVTLRFHERFNVYADGEVARSDRVYFQTSLRDYEKIRIRSNVQPWNSLTLTFNFGHWHNENNGPERPFEFVSRQAGVAAVWTPATLKNVRLLAEYARITWYTDTLFINPPTLQYERYLFRENGHSATSMIDVGVGSRGPRFAFGGNLWRSAGSRPSHFYQPMARVTVPAGGHVDFNAEWRWFGLNEPYYNYENFRSHQGIISLRFH